MRTQHRIAALLLLGLAAAGIGVLVFQKTRRPPQGSTEAAERIPGKLIVYYFHGTARCDTCLRIEKLAEESLRTNFAGLLRSGRLEWRPVNVDEPENEHFNRDYELSTRAVVLSDVRDGRQFRWKNLEKIWGLVEDREPFLRYIAGEVQGFLD